MVSIILNKTSVGVSNSVVIWQEPVIVRQKGSNINTTRWFIKGKWGIISFDFDILYIKKYQNKPFLWCLDIDSFLFFYRNIVNGIVGVFFRWYVQLQFKGLGFKLFYDKHLRVLKLDVGYAHDLYFSNISRSLGFNFKKRWRGASRLVVCSTNKMLLYQYVRVLISLRLLNPYKFRGLFVWEWILVPKTGKKKQFL